MICGSREIWDSRILIHWKPKPMVLTKRISSKRLLLSVTGTAIVLFGVIAGFVLKHLHFSYETSRTLAWIQGNHQPVGEFYATRPTIVGHPGRKSSSHASEPPAGKNSSGVQEPFDANVDWLEVDVAASADRQLVTFYDEQVDPTTNSEERVSDLEPVGLRVPRQRVNSQRAVRSLADLFKDIQARHQNWIFNITESGIKSELLSWLEERIANHDLEHERVILFGTDEVIEEYRLSGYSLGYVVNSNESLHWLKAIFCPSKMLTRCNELDCHYLVIPGVFAAPTLLKNAETQNVKIWINGLESASEYVYFAKRRVQGFVTPDPQLALQAFAHAIPASDQPKPASDQPEPASDQPEPASDQPEPAGDRS